MKINRRKFIRASALGAVSVGAGALLAKSEWLFPVPYPGDAKQVFSKCGTCSQTFFCLLNREFAHPDKTEELASDPLAGGMMSTQNQCGMLWGSVLAAGAESYRRFNDKNKAINQSISASQHLANSFYKRAKTLNCRDILGFDFKNKAGLAEMLTSSLPGGFENSVCMNLAEKWAPEAFDAAQNGLSSQNEDMPEVPLSCAAIVVEKMGGTKKEIVTASGLAGGIGLSGQACGALGAAIWKSSLDYCKDNHGETGYKNPKSKEILEAFKNETDSEFLCEKICDKRFESIEEHTAYMNNGGCSKLIEVLSS